MPARAKKAGGDTPSGKPPDENLKRLTIRIDLAGGRQLGPGKVRLLELVDTSGSITASAKLMEMSYRRAWLLIDELNHMFETPLVETRMGGRGGATARLSWLGRAVVQIYRSIEAEAHGVSATRLNELARNLRRDSPTPAKEPK